MTVSDAAGEAEVLERARYKRGLIPAVTLAGGVSAFLLWSVTASDPYWRLPDGETVPAPIYGTTSEAMTFSGPSESGRDPLSGVARPSPALAAVNRLAATVSEPQVLPTLMTALAAPLAPQLLGPITDQNGVDGAAPGPALAVRAGIDEATEVAIALEPAAISASDSLRDRDVASLGRLSSMIAPTALIDAPMWPHFASDPSAEAAMGLDRADLAEVQSRLALAGFDPQGADGVFGPMTRAAIEDAQRAWGYPATGYLEPGLHAELRQRTEDAYQAANERRKQRVARQQAPATDDGQVAQLDGGTCARDVSGRILASQSLKCDLTGFKESFGAGGGGFAGNEAATGGRRSTYVER